MEQMATTIERDPTPEVHVAATALISGRSYSTYHSLPACRKAGVVFRLRGSAAPSQTLGARHRRPNKSFKPNPLRYANHMADEACHVVCSTTRLGLTLVLADESNHSHILRITARSVRSRTSCHAGS